MTRYAKTAALHMAIDGPAEDLRPDDFTPISQAQAAYLLPLLAARFAEVVQEAEEAREDLEADYRLAEDERSAGSLLIDDIRSAISDLRAVCAEIAETGERFAPEDVVTDLTSILDLY